jgi:hemoglobin
MNNSHRTKWIVAACVVAMAWTAAAGAGDAPTVAEQINGLSQMCSDSAEERAKRQNEKALYDRLGGYDTILEFTTEVVRLHKQNPDIQKMFASVDSEQLAKHVADFVASGTGGPSEVRYTGRDMPSAHENLHLTDADFMSAGGDIVTAMKTMGYGQNEIDEMLCILLSLKDQVVF